MPGHGPAPKDPKRRARRNADPIRPRLLRVDVVTPPDLPAQHTWSDRTREWWQVWRESPQAEHFTATDWDFLTDTALVHDRLWRGDVTVASELRLRLAKVGATTEDRNRLRMVAAEADEKDAKREGRQTRGARQVYGPLKPAPERAARAAQDRTA